MGKSSRKFTHALAQNSLRDKGSCVGWTLNKRTMHSCHSVYDYEQASERRNTFKPTLILQMLKV